MSTITSFKLEILQIRNSLVKLEVESSADLSKEEIGEVLLTAFKELEVRNELLLRLILFSSLESLSGSKEIMLTIKQYIDTYYSFD